MSWDLLTSVSGLEAAKDGVADGPGGCTDAEEDIGLDDPGLGITLGLELTGSDIVLNVSVDIVFDFSVTVEGTEPTGVGVCKGCKWHRSATNPSHNQIAGQCECPNIEPIQ